MVAIFNASLELWGALLCLFLLICGSVQKSTDLKEQRRFLSLFFYTMLVLISDSMAYLFRGEKGQAEFYIVLIANFCGFLFTYLLCISFQNYVLCQVKIPQRLFRIAKAVEYLGSVYIVLLLISQFTGWFYNIDADNIYIRGKYFWISQSYGLIAFVILFIVLSVARKQFSSRRYVALLSYVIFPLIALVVQIFIYGFSLINIAVLLSLMWMFVVRQMEINQEMIFRERRIAEQQTKTVISQVQPHFLYNVLNTLYYLCDKDPERTKHAIGDFADYLRGNLRYINQFDMVSVQSELDHTRKYLELEKLRFGDKLNWVFEIETTSFKVPPLSIQPIVENAVKHGIRKRRDGGTIWIRVNEESTKYTIMVEDNGIGFDEIAQWRENESGQVGILSVKERMLEMCNGTLEISSKKGKGTIAIFTITKEK